MIGGPLKRVALEAVWKHKSASDESTKDPGILTAMHWRCRLVDSSGASKSHDCIVLNL